MRHNSSLSHTSRVVYTVLVIGFIYVIHEVLPLYSNSSFLSLFASENTVGLLYMLSSATTVFGFLFIPFLLRKIGNYKTAMWLIVIQILLFYGFTITGNSIAISAIFVAETTVVALIGFCIDVFLEVHFTKENTGTLRSMYVATENSAWIIAPLIASMIIGAALNYRDVYVAALYMLFPLLYLVYRNFRNFKDPHYYHFSFWQTLKHTLRHKKHSGLFAANIILQTFYAWMTIYLPIYLNKTLGFSWTQIGIILTIMLLPFPFVQWPLGRLADKKWGEKEILILGFALLGLSTIALAGLISASVLLWSIALFITRIGAASVEVMIEVYFFKTVDPQNSDMLGFFRTTRPLAYFIAPILAGVILLFTPDISVQFVVLGLMCVAGIIPVWVLRDTR